MANSPSAIRFSGGNQYISVWNSATIKNLTSFTWWGWVKPAAVTDSSSQIVWMERQGTGQKIRFGVTAYIKATASRKSYLRFLFGPKDGVDPVAYAYPTEIWTDDRWHHIGFNAVLNGSPATYEILLDGTRVATGNLVLPSGITAVNNTLPIAISAGVQDVCVTRGDPIIRKAGTYWSGKLADVAIFNTKHTESDARSYIGTNDFTNVSDSTMIYNFRFTEGTAENTGPTTTLERISNNVSTLYFAGSPSALLWTLDRPFLGSGVLDTTRPASFTTTGTTSITSSGFTAGWNATTDDVYVQYYELQVATVSNFSSYTSYNAGLATTYKVTGQTSGTNLYWRVRAFDAASNASSYTATVSLTTATTGDITPPSTPVQNAVSALTYAGFTANWTAASDNIAVTGYKIDVGLDSNFNTYLTGFRNRDVGNVTSFGVTGTNGTTNYWTRIRAYDAVGNESPSSNVIKTKTSPPPDTIAPDVVGQLSPTSLTYNAFTANWEPGVDNIGVVGYQLDVSIDPLFGSTIGGFNSLAVGNVLSYRVTGLTPETVYYYRTRAVDAASNVSSNTDTPMSVTTLPASVAAGAPITTYYSAVQDGYVDSANATTNYAAATTLFVAGNGTTATKLTYFEFDLTGSVGQITSALLFVYCITAPTGAITITGPTGVVTINENTLTYNTRPTLGGATTSFTPLTNATGYTVDITSLLTLGNVAYTISLSTTVNTSFTLASAEDTVNPVPLLEVTQDPTVNTQIMEIDVVQVAGLRTNSCKNPSAETDTSNWTASGASGSTLSRFTGTSLVGSACFQIVGTGSAVNEGIITNGNTAAALVGQNWTIVFWARVASGTLAVNAAIQENDNTGTQINTTPTAFTLDTTWRRFRITKTLVSGSVAYVGFWLYNPAATAFTMHLDAVLIENTSTGNAGTYFDGNSSGASWTGTANISSSTIGAGGFLATAAYLGDANSNNTGYFMFKRSDAAFSDWNRFAAVDAGTVVNHSTKQITATIGRSYGNMNAIRNPSFELGTTYWTTTGTGITLNQSQNYVFGDAGLDITYDASGGARVFTYAPTDASMMALNGDSWTGSIYLKASAGTPTVTLVITEATTVHTSTSMLLSAGWQRISFTTSLVDAATRSVTFGVSYTGGAVTLSADAAMMEKSAFLNPYIDGDQPDGDWESTPQLSVSGMNLSPLTSYDIQITTTDPDGVINSGDVPTIGTFSDSFSTLNIPLNVTTTGTLTVVPGDDYIQASVTYLGDDNNNNSILFEWRRSDLTNWTSPTTVYDRTHKTASAIITNLGPGIAYVVRATFTDADNVSGTYGINPLVANVNTSTTSSITAGNTLITFGGFVLMDGSDTQGVIGVTQHNAFGMPTKRLTTEPLSRLDGEVETQNLWGKRPINMSGYVTGTDRADVYNNLAALKRALAVAKQPLVINTFTQNGRYYTASLESFGTAEVAAVNIMHLTWDAVFTCADPFAYDADAQTTSFSATNGNSVAVTNCGDVSVDTLFTVTTTNASTPLSLTITNTTTGERITPLVTILNTDTLIIDSQKVSVTKNGVDVDYAGSPPRLVVGSNTFLFTINAGSIGVTLSWRQKYL